MILRAKQISKSYRSPQKVTVLSEISLDLDLGESIAICGRSGEGKTTLLHILGALEKADSGSIEIAGIPLTLFNASSLRSEHIGFIFQSYNLLEDFSVLENILMPLRIARRFPDQRHALDLLAAVGLEERAHFPAKLLSGGERQRAAIARALCNNPDLILADEPSGNLDQANAERIGSLLFSLVKQHGKSLILVTHDASLARLCDHQYLLSNGHLQKMNEPQR